VRSFLPAVFIVGAATFGFCFHRGSTPVVQSAVSAAEGGDREITRAIEALKVLRTAPEHGLGNGPNNASTLEAAINRLKTPELDSTDRMRQLAAVESETNRALLAFAHDVAIGRVSPSAINPHWKSQREVPDLAASLDQFANRGLEQWIASVQPQHPEYVALQRALRALRSQQQQGMWPKVPARPFKPGTSDPAVAILRERLAASGELAPATVTDTATYDEPLTAAVKTFQEHHALKATGLVDQATLAAMNVPLSERIRQVEINLERWRWMPDDFGARHFLVNIPAFLLMARENGTTVRAIRVIVGKTGHETPIFSGDLETVVFSPYWNVPDSIAEDETAPAVRRDPSFLTRNQIEVVRRSTSGVKVVDPAAVNWYDPDELSQLSFRQRPGAKNALGHVKFLFPNAFNVYLHDTPTDSLFVRPRRAFSHGCVRVEEPEALASYVLRDRPEWTTERISSAMNAGVEKYVQLDETIPVHIVYFTTWVDEQGGLYFLPDVYGYDARQSKLTK
jgi:murein L,D-transpeptidase YcbB/YkuD